MKKPHIATNAARLLCLIFYVFTGCSDDPNNPSGNADGGLLTHDSGATPDIGTSGDAEPGCGNGIVERAEGEECDDGNTSNADGCDDMCRVVDPSLYCDTANGMVFDAEQGMCVIPDTTPPELLEISFNTPQLQPDETTATITFLFNEPVKQFEAADISVSHGTVSQPLKGESTPGEEAWTATFTREGSETGRASFRVEAGRYADIANNLNTVVTTGSLDLLGEPPACDLRFSGVAVHEEAAIFQWPTGTSQTPMDLSRDDVHAYPFITGSNPDFNGQLSFIPFSNTFTVTKDIWLSECPGGPIATGAAFDGVCDKKAVQTTLFWAQNDQTEWRCPLQLNTQYYLNVRNTPASCEHSTGCDAKVQHLVSGSAD